MAIITALSIWIIPILIGTILVYGTYKRIPTYETFVDGGKEGFSMAISIIPYLVGMLVAIGVFRASGAMDMVLNTIKPFLSIFGVPSEIVPLAIIRPISGTGALGIMSDLLKQYTPDSFIGRLASTLQSSTDTTFYVLTVYFGAVGIHKTGDALKVGLLADCVGVISSIIFVSLIFGR
ncbi:spore maturation protein [Terrilactibacillus laevilacticus]|uniref:Spore maturation protein n=1 Tax=Terrilactibacillus laevilacticus TaxID=1380157 RepID=A0ABW5PS33_9BACI|nr:spore maturation protein [Terrilactibacillus laevilacticus]